MKTVLFYLVTVPIAALIVVLAVVNRAPVTIILDPFRPDDPALAFTLPLYLLVLGTLIVGVIIGGSAVWFKQGRFRKSARENRSQAARWRNEAGRLKDSLKAETGRPALPAGQNR